MDLAWPATLPRPEELDAVANLSAALTAALLCMKEQLVNSSDATSVKAYIAQAAPVLSVEQMMREMQTHFMPGIRAAVGAPPPDAAFELTPGGYF